MPEQNPPKRQHVIPECYLKRFTEQEEAWVIDTESDSKPYRTGLDNILCVKDFYTVSDFKKKEKATLLSNGLVREKLKRNKY
jgi:hypothetical protein